MNTILTEDDEVKFKSYCPKHSGLDGAEYRDSGGEEECTRDKKRRIGRLRAEEEEDASAQVNSRTSGDALSSHQQEKRVNLRKLKLEAMEEEFYLFVQAEEVARHLKLSAEAADFLYQYWKLKRKANFNQPLLTPKKDEEDSLARREQEVLRCRLQLFTHLRQDLERVSSSPGPAAAVCVSSAVPKTRTTPLLQVRNLTYMVTRREKMKRSMWKVQEQIFQHQVRLLDHELLTGQSDGCRSPGRGYMSNHLVCDRRAFSQGPGEPRLPGLVIISRPSVSSFLCSVRTESQTRTPESGETKIQRQKEPGGPAGSPEGRLQRTPGLQGQQRLPKRRVWV